MAFEKLIRRIAYEMKCDCGHSEMVDDKAPREKQCPYCKKWNEFKRVEWTGPDNLGQQNE